MHNRGIKGKLYHWFPIIAGALLICWVIYSIIAEFTYLNQPEPLRSALLSGEAEIVHPLSTLIMKWLMWLLWTAIGAGAIYSGIKGIRKPESKE